MEQDIKLGAYGWRYDNWKGTFYPEELPVGKDDDWRLAYYSNEFNCVLVPASYWESSQKIDCEAWLNDVHENFQFFVECRESMFEHVSLPALTEQLKALRTQLSALVFLDDKFIHADSAGQFDSLVDSLGLNIYSAVENFTPATNKALQPVWQIDKPCASSFAYIENDLSDLRLAKTQVENFMAKLIKDKSTKESDGHNSEISMIISHLQLQTDDLIRFRSVLQIMGY